MGTEQGLTGAREAEGRAGWELLYHAVWPGRCSTEPAALLAARAGVTFGG